MFSTSTSRSSLTLRSFIDVIDMVSLIVDRGASSPSSSSSLPNYATETTRSHQSATLNCNKEVGVCKVVGGVDGHGDNCCEFGKIGQNESSDNVRASKTWHELLWEVIMGLDGTVFEKKCSSAFVFCYQSYSHNIQCYLYQFSF